MSLDKFYIYGQWVRPSSSHVGPVTNPATEEVIAQVAYGNAEDVDRAVMAARRAFAAFSSTSRAERAALLRRIAAVMETRLEHIAQVISSEIGVPISYARSAHAAAGPAHIEILAQELEAFEFEWHKGTTLVERVPIGVAALTTPWNVPINQMVIKVAPALAAGCTMVLKPSETAPSNALIFAEILDEAGVPPGVFNLVHGDGPGVGTALTSHPEVDFVSFTGSTRAGIAVSQSAAPTIKKVALELGGKSGNILLPDVDLEEAVTKGVRACMQNSGQACSAPTRMIVPRERMDEAAAIAAKIATSYRVGDPSDASTELGPVANANQFARVQDYIRIGIEEGAVLAAGGFGRPEGLTKGAFVWPTIFAHVSPQMRIAQEEIFGPVLVMIPYDTVDEAIEIADGTVYGLAAYVQGKDLDQVRKVARQLRAGRVLTNYPSLDRTAPLVASSNQVLVANRAAMGSKNIWNIAPSSDLDRAIIDHEYL